VAATLAHACGPARKRWRLLAVRGWDRALAVRSVVSNARHCLLAWLGFAVAPAPVLPCFALPAQRFFSSMGR